MRLAGPTFCFRCDYTTVIYVGGQQSCASCHHRVWCGFAFKGQSPLVRRGKEFLPSQDRRFSFSFSWTYTCWCAHRCIVLLLRPRAVRSCSGLLLLGRAMRRTGAGGAGCLVPLGPGWSFLLHQQLKPSLCWLLPRQSAGPAVDCCGWWGLLGTTHRAFAG